MFCAIPRDVPDAPDRHEVDRVAEGAVRLGLSHVVITSVARDDLKDGGAGHFGKVIRAVHTRLPKATVEVLTPDFKGDPSAIERVVEASPEIYNHNLETIPRLQKKLRPYARYERSLEVLRHVKRTAEEIWTKSGLMVGLGERPEEVLQSLKDLRDAGCQIVTLGQYLQSDVNNLPVVEFVRPEQFMAYETMAKDLGFSYVFSGPFVRSSYLAEEAMTAITRSRQQRKDEEDDST